MHTARSHRPIRNPRRKQQWLLHSQLHVAGQTFFTLWAEVGPGSPRARPRCEVRPVIARRACPLLCAEGRCGGALDKYSRTRYGSLRQGAVWHDRPSAAAPVLRWGGRRASNSASGKPDRPTTFTTRAWGCGLSPLAGAHKRNTGKCRANARPPD